MNSKAFRVFVLLLQILCFAVSIGVCVYGIVIIEEVDNSYPYIAAVVRLVVVLLVTVAYYKSSVSNINPGNAFIILALFFLTVTELRVLSYFTQLTGFSILPPRVSVRLQMFSQYMLMFLLIGYAIHYQNNEHSTITRFLLLGTASVLFISMLVPATQDIDGVWQMTAPLLLLCILSGVALVTQLILSFSEPTAMGKLRNYAILMMIVGNTLSFILNTLTFTIMGSTLFFIGGFIAMIVTLRNSVIL